MRRHVPETGWGPRPWAEPTRSDAGVDSSVEVIEPEERTEDLTMERLGSFQVELRRSAGRERRQASQRLPGQIADDWVDGLHVYAQPPRRARPVDRLGRLRERISVGMLPFALLAVALAVASLAGAGLPAGQSAAAPATLLSAVGRLGYALGLTLLPIGVLMWRPDAWRSARLVLLGSIAWSTVPALAGLALWFARRSPGLTTGFGMPLSVVAAGALAIACLGPGIMGLGLERSRRYRDSWMAPVCSRALVIAALIAPLNVVQWLPQAGAAIDPDLVARSVSGWVLPFECGGLFILAYVCVSAAMSGEPQRRLWQFGAAGVSLLGLITFDEMAYGWLPGIAGQMDLAGRGMVEALLDVALLAAMALILIGFASPVWSASRDAVRASRAAPDTVFTWGPAADADPGEPLPMAAVVAVAAGKDHALALDEDGRVGAWGDDTFGQIDVPEGLADVTAIAAGDGFSLALRADGTVAAWGADDRGQTDVPADLADVATIAAGSDFGLALRRDGSVVGWGDAASRVLPVPPGLTTVTAISAGEYHALALRRDGRVVAWGDNAFGQSRVPTTVRGVTAISAGGDFSLALLDDGTVAAWGDNSYGQLDVPSGLQDVTAISAGVFHAVALRAGGDVVGWGGGQRRGESHPWRLVDFKAVAAGEGFSLALRVA
jgi:Regulator of chromosome condensation (RCC1) repeat